MNKEIIRDTAERMLEIRSFEIINKEITREMSERTLRTLEIMTDCYTDRSFKIMNKEIIREISERTLEIMTDCYAGHYSMPIKDTWSYPYEPSHVFGTYIDPQENTSEDIPKEHIVCDSAEYDLEEDSYTSRLKLYNALWNKITNLHIKGLTWIYVPDVASDSEKKETLLEVEALIMCHILSDSMLQKMDLTTD